MIVLKLLFDAALTSWTAEFGSESQLRDVSAMLNKFFGKIKHQRIVNPATIMQPLDANLTLKNDVLANIETAWTVFCRTSLTKELLEVVEAQVAQIQGVLEFTQE